MKPYKIYEVDVVITCEAADGTPVDWNAIPRTKTTDDSTVDVNYIWLVPAQDGPFFYTRSHFSALQNCALLFSIYFSFFRIKKMHNTI